MGTMMWQSVHPHACGEYPVLFYCGDHDPGSPPGNWGILKSKIYHIQPSRSTPTDVGNTSPSRADSKERSVHPHRCGEYISSRNWTVPGGGSPPNI